MASDSPARSLDEIDLSALRVRPSWLLFGFQLEERVCVCTRARALAVPSHLTAVCEQHTAVQERLQETGAWEQPDHRKLPIYGSGYKWMLSNSASPGVGARKLVWCRVE